MNSLCFSQIIYINLKHVLSTVCGRNWAQMREQPQYVMENLDDTAVFFDVCKSLEGKYSFGEAKERVTTHIAETSCK